jgi:Leucine-rich repeat (LRR) protein
MMQVIDMIEQVVPSTSISMPEANNASSTNNTVTATSSTSSDFNMYEFKRSRSVSPYSQDDLIDLSNLDLEEADTSLHSLIEKSTNPLSINILLLNNNLLTQFPSLLGCFNNLKTLDISNNQIKILSVDICKLFNLRVLIASNNLLEDFSLPKELPDKLPLLETINLGGNLFAQFPYQLLEMRSLREIYLGSNKITCLPKNFEKLQKLEILYLGGNQLKTVPEELCQLRSLSSLNLSNNLIHSLPNNITRLKRIKTLALHNNNLTTLPIEIVKLNLQELSLRNNPLINRFAREAAYNVPSLLELSGRVIKSKSIPYSEELLPNHLVKYLNSAQSCLNPKCKGVYFTSKVEHIKFVDFCGKYKVPFMQYLCSSSCNEKITNKSLAKNSKYDFISSSDSESSEENDRILKKILLG